MPKLIETRAEAIGVKPKVLAARTKRSLKGIRERISQLAVPWEEINDGLRLEVEELLAHFDEFERSIDETVEWLNEAAPY